MKVFKPIGSKERLFEIFQNVNKIRLNENIYESDTQSNNANSILNDSYDLLKNNNLNIAQTNTQSDGNDSFVELICKNNQNDKIIFRFKIISVEGDQEEVYDVKNVLLDNFIFESGDGSENIELNDDALKDFNQNYGNELFDVIEKYIDIDSAEPDEIENADELMEAIKLIDAIKQNSYPYGGGSDRMQNGKAYANEKPTNLKLRIKASELDKYIQESDDYPSEIPKKFSTKTGHKKTKKVHKKTLKLDESTDQDKYEDVVFLQGDEAFQPLEILDTKGQDAALEYLKQWHYPGEHMGSSELGHGSNDKTYEKDGYIMSWNPSLGYIGLQYDLSNMNEEVDIEDEVDVDVEDETPMSQDMDIEQITKDKEENGEMLKGGKGDDKSPSDFSIDQVMMGLGVEKEHTDDPTIAIEIVLDHLAEDPEYYTSKEDPETSAQANASADAEDDEKEVDDEENDDNDKEMTDLLLGYKPLNVGDEIEDNDIESIRLEDDEELFESFNKAISNLKKNELSENTEYDEEGDPIYKRTFSDKINAEPYVSIKNNLAVMTNYDQRIYGGKGEQFANGFVDDMLKGIDNLLSGNNKFNKKFTQEQIATLFYETYAKRQLTDSHVGIQPMKFNFSNGKVTGIANDSTRGVKNNVADPRYARIVPALKEELKKVFNELKYPISDNHINALLNDIIVIYYNTINTAVLNYPDDKLYCAVMHVIRHYDPCGVGF